MEDTIIKNEIKGLTVLNIALLTVYSAFHDNDEAFFNEDFGQSLLSAIEVKTGVTFEMLKEMYEEKNQKLCESQKTQLLEDAKTMTLKQLQAKYDCTEKSIRCFLDRNHVTPISNKKRVTEEELIGKINSFNGKYTLSDISVMTKVSFNKIKQICLLNELPFKSSRFNNVL